MPAQCKFQCPAYLKYSAAFILSFVVLVLLYLSGLYGPFLLDDLPSIQPAQLASFSWSSLLEISTQNQSGPLGRVLPTLSFALNHYFWGEAPFSYKFVNLMLHFGLSYLIIWLSYLLIRSYRPKLRYSGAIAHLVGFIWLIHPLHVSTVLYVVQRMTILAQLFTVLGCCLYVYARLRQWCRYRYIPWYALSFFCWVLGILSKETAILFPFYLFIIECFILKFRTKSLKNTYRFYQCAKILCLLFILLFLFAFWSYQEHFQIIFSEKSFSLIERLMTQVKVLIFYIRLIYFPILSKMSLYHDSFLIVHSVNLSFVLSTFFIFFLIISIIFLRKRVPFLSLGLSWFFVSHLLESTILPLELVFEHRNYLASFGLIIALIVPTAQWIQNSKIRFRKPYLALSSIFILLLMSMTWARTEQWSSIDKFLHTALIDNPDSARTRIEFANWLLSHKAYVQAYHELLQAKKIQPTNVGIDIHILLLHCYAEHVPNLIYKNIEEKIKQYPITPYVIVGLNQIVKNFSMQQCNIIDKNQVQHIIQSSYQNPFLEHRPKYKSILYHLDAAMMLMNEEPSDAKIMLMRSFEAYPRHFDALITKAMIELSEDDIESASDSIEILSKCKNKIYAPKERIKALEETVLLKVR